MPESDGPAEQIPCSSCKAKNSYSFIGYMSYPYGISSVREFLDFKASSFVCSSCGAKNETNELIIFHHMPSRALYFCYPEVQKAREHELRKELLSNSSGLPKEIREFFSSRGFELRHELLFSRAEFRKLVLGLIQGK